MGYFQDERKTEKVVFPTDSKYWAVVFVELKWADTKRYTVVDEDGTADFVGAADQFLNNAIKEWNLDDASGSVLPITPENIDRLNKDDALALIKVAGGSAEDPASKKNSTNKS